MSEPDDTVLRGHIPMRLSSDALVSEYRARDYVATGKSISSDDGTEEVPSVSPIPPEMLPRRARVDDASSQLKSIRGPSQPIAAFQDTAPRPAPVQSPASCSDVVLGMLSILNQQWTREPNPMEQSILRSAQVMFSELASRAESLAQRPPMAKKNAPPKKSKR